MVHVDEVQVTIDPRRSRRRTVRVPAAASLRIGDTVSITIDDLSAVGFSAAIPLPLAPGSLLRVALPVGRMPEAVVIRLDERKVVCEFMAPLTAPEIDVMSDLWGARPDKREGRSGRRYPLS